MANKEYPFPWRVENINGTDYLKHIGGFKVVASNDETVFHGGTYTGDGDMEINLDGHQMTEMVNTLNDCFRKSNGA